MLLKQPNNALYWLNEALQYDESFVEGLLMRPDLYVSAGNYSEARTDYAQAIDLVPQKPRPYLAFAQIATQMHDLDLAFNTLDEGLMTVPAEERKALHELRAYLLLKDGQLLDGLEELDALGSATDELPTWLLLARADARLDSDEIEDGLADFDLLLTREPSHSEALQGRLDALLALERRQEASTLLNQMIELTPTADLYNQRGDFFFEEAEANDTLPSELDAARKDYERAIELEPRHPLVSYNLALILLEQEDAQSALPYLDLALEISPYDEERLRIRSRARRLAGLPYAAWLDADRAIKSDPEYVEGYVTRAKASIALKNEQDALKDLGMALELFPEYGDALAARAQLFTAMKRKKKALNDWKQYLALPKEEQDDEILQKAMTIVAKG
jgi:tetratricopeptide (TPR) repeat protein